MCIFDATYSIFDPYSRRLLRFARSLALCSRRYLTRYYPSLESSITKYSIKYYCFKLFSTLSLIFLYFNIFEYTCQVLSVYLEYISSILIEYPF